MVCGNRGQSVKYKGMIVCNECPHYDISLTDRYKYCKLFRVFLYRLKRTDEICINFVRTQR